MHPYRAHAEMCARPARLRVHIAQPRHCRPGVLAATAAASSPAETSPWATACRPELLRFLRRNPDCQLTFSNSSGTEQAPDALIRVPVHQHTLCMHSETLCYLLSNKQPLPVMDQDELAGWMEALHFMYPIRPQQAMTWVSCGARIASATDLHDGYCNPSRPSYFLSCNLSPCTGSAIICRPVLSIESATTMALLILYHHIHHGHTCGLTGARAMTEYTCTRGHSVSVGNGSTAVGCPTSPVPSATLSQTCSYAYQRAQSMCMLVTCQYAGSGDLQLLTVALTRHAPMRLTHRRVLLQCCRCWTSTT